MSRAPAVVAAVLGLLLSTAATAASSSLPLEPGVQAAQDMLLAGDAAGAREAARELAQREPPPLGAVSIWLAAGAEGAHDAWRFHVDQHHGEPRVHAIAARRARHAGDRWAAARHVAYALQLSPPDALVVAEARQLGWSVDDAADGALPGPGAVSGAAEPWLLLGVVVLLLGGYAALRSRDWRGGAGLLVALLLVGLLPHRAPVAPRPELPAPLRAPLSGADLGAGCQALPTFVTADALQVSTVCADGTYRHVQIGAGAPGEDGPVLHHRVWASDTPDVVDARMEAAVESALVEAERAGFRLDAWLTRAPTTSTPATPWPVGGEAGQLALAGLLVIAALLMATLTLPAILSSVSAGLARGAPWRRLLGLGLMGLVVVHALGPDHLVMSFGVYEIEPFMVDGRVPRYGPGAVWFYGPIQWALGVDHAWILRLNRVFGLLSALTTVALAGRLFARPAVPALAACVLAALPVLWLAHTSESILVGPTWVLLTALWLAVEPGPRPAFVAAALGFAAAALSRPEMAVAMAGAPFVVALLRGRERTLGWATMALLVLAVVGMQASWLLDKAAEMQRSGSLDFAREGGLGTLLWNMGGVIGAHDIFLNPTMTPTVLVLALVAAVARPSTRWKAAWLIGWGVVWMMATTVDLTAVSIPRLQLPVLLLLTPVVAAGLEQILVQAPAARQRAMVSGFVVLFVAGACLNGWWLLRADNAAAEEALWRDAVAALPDAEPGCLLTLGHADPPDGGLSPRHVPGYLLTTRESGWTVDDLYRASEVHQSCRGRTWALLGVRCYVHLRRPDEPAPDGAPEIEGCAQFRAGWHLSPVFERALENRGDRDYPMYPAGGPLRVGLYEVVGPLK